MKNISIKFNLKFPKMDTSPILISASWEGQRYSTSTGLKINTKQFDKNKGRIKNWL